MFAFFMKKEENVNFHKKGEIPLGRFKGTRTKWSLEKVKGEC